MQTPLIFKLLLLLTFALRLLKINKKNPVRSGKNYFVIESEVKLKSPKLLLDTKSASADEAIKVHYRKQARQTGANETDVRTFQSFDINAQLIYVAYKFSKFYHRGGLYRFLWHGNDWLIAFGQSLEIVNHHKSRDFKKLVAEIAQLNDFRFNYKLIDWESVYPFPDVSQHYESFQKFDDNFELEDYLNEILKKISSPSSSEC
jgi:hypothetical protein